MSERKQNIRRCILFISIFVILLVILSFILKPKNVTKNTRDSDAFSKGRILEAENTVDVVFIGDSLCYCSFVPALIFRDYGITSYVTGTVAQKPKTTISILKETFKEQSPKCVVLETDCLFRNLPVKNAIRSAFANTFPIFNYHNRWKNLTLSDFSMKYTYVYFQNSKGYRYTTMHNAADISGYMEYTTKKEKIPNDNYRILEEIKELCDRNETELILVSVPSVQCYNTRRHNSLLEASGKLETPYINMNLIWQELNIDWSYDTRDGGDHLNYYGACKVTEYMAEYLKDNCDLEDHRGDELYENWASDAEDFFEIITKIYDVNK